MLAEGQKMSNIFFHKDITLTGESTLQGGEWPGVPWYPDTPETGAVLQDSSWFIKICRGLFPRVRALQDFPYSCQLHLAHHIKLQRTSDIMPLWGAYVEYPLPTEYGTCAMATSINEKMGGPYIKDSLTPWTQTAPQTTSCVCPFCNKSHNSRDSLMNHIRFQWRTIKEHIKCATARPNITSRKVKPGELHWRRSHPPLMNHTRASKTEATFTSLVWPDPPDNEESAHRGQIFKCICKE